MKIPKKYNTYNKKIEYISKKIDKLFDKTQSSGATATRRMVKMGEYFIKSKGIVKNHKKKWKSHLARRFPYLSQRTVERYMSLARYVNLEKYPALAFLSQECLTQLIIYRNESTVGKLLKKHGVDASRDLEGRESIGIFKQEVGAVLEKLTGGWTDSDAFANSSFHKKIKSRAEANLDAKLRKIRKEQWIDAPPEKVAKQINSRSKTVGKGLSSLMRHRPAVYDELDMDLLEELYELLGRFLKLYERPDDELFI